MPSQLPAPEILLEQGACLLIQKPGGLLTQGPPGIDSLETRIKQFLKNGRTRLLVSGICSGIES